MAIKAKKEEKGEIVSDPISKKGQAAVVKGVSEEVYEKYCGVEGGLGILEQKALDKIAEIDLEDEGALEEFKEVIDNFLDAFEAEYPFLGYNYNIKYNMKTLTKILDNEQILDHKKIKALIKKESGVQVKKVATNVLKVIKLKKSGGELKSPAEIEILKMDELEDGFGAYNNDLLNGIEKQFAPYLAQEKIEHYTLEVNSRSTSSNSPKKLVLTFKPEETILSEFTGESVGSKNKRPKNPFKNA